MPPTDPRGKRIPAGLTVCRTTVNLDQVVHTRPQPFRSGRADMQRSSPRPAVLSLILLGIAAGYLSGLFGVGGGIIVVPLLLMLGLDQRLAAGTSVAAL